MMILIKVSDISNEARPMEVAEPWLDCLLQEFFNQVPHNPASTSGLNVNRNKRLHEIIFTSPYKISFSCILLPSKRY